ncbi:MAG: nucleotide disphospho-sugar-binding domain-containing protein [Pseudomonadota bacterium]
MPGLPRVLFFAESVTLAHLARPLVLAQALRGSFEVALACAPAYREFASDAGVDLLPLDSITPAEFRRAVERGARFYDLPVLRRYTASDLDVIERFRPDVMVGDFRPSLAVSARRAGVPFVALLNAHWSPGYRHADYPMPVLPITRLIGPRLFSPVFAFARKAAIAHFAQPFDALRREHGLPTLGGDLRRHYADADAVAYPDIPELYPVAPLPARHAYLGPVLWDPPTPLPEWWNTLDDTPVLGYASLGSSGEHGLLPRILDVLGELNGVSLVATAGADAGIAPSPRLRLAPYLPGSAATARARFVLCNGGSMTVQQALRAGVPVIGLCGNMDQMLNMAPVAAAGAGILLRADAAPTAAIHDAVRRVLDDPAYRAAAQALAPRFAGHDAARRLGGLLADLLPAAQP